MHLNLAGELASDNIGKHKFTVKNLNFKNPKNQEKNPEKVRKKSGNKTEKVRKMSGKHVRKQFRKTYLKKKT